MKESEILPSKELNSNYSIFFINTHVLTIDSL